MSIHNLTIRIYCYILLVLDLIVIVYPYIIVIKSVVNLIFTVIVIVMISIGQCIAWPFHRL